MKSLTTKVSFLLVWAFLLTGCREGYLSEKAFWKASQILKTVKHSDIQAKGPRALEPAIDAFEKLVEKYPGTPKAAESLFVIADLRYRQKNFAAALESLEKIVLNFSGMPGKAAEARFRIIRLHEIQGNWEKAEGALWEAADYHPLDPRGLSGPVSVILHYRKAGNRQAEETAYQRAREYYEKALKRVGPIQAAAAIKNYRAAAELARGEWQAARKIWLSILEEYPQSPYAPLSLSAAAHLSWQAKEAESARQWDEEFIRRYPRHELAVKSAVRLGMDHQRKKEFEASRRWYETALSFQKANPMSVAEIKLLIGRSYEEEGRWEEAARIFQEVESRYPASYGALQVPLIFSAHYEREGESDRAKKILEEAIQRYRRLEEKYPNSRIAAFAERLRNEAYAMKGAWEEILTNFDRNMGEEKSAARKGSWLFLKALVVESRLKDPKKALSLYESFLAEYPRHPLTKLAKERQEILVRTP